MVHLGPLSTSYSVSTGSSPAPASVVDGLCDWDLIRCTPSCQPTWRPWRLNSHGWRFNRCTGCRTLWAWDGHWREALSPAALARLETEALGEIL